MSSCLTTDDVLSALIRPTLRAAPGKTLLIADYQSVEARGLAWVAGEQSLLDAFAAGADVYCQFASKLFGRRITPKDAAERQVGKVTVLGAGYGLGPTKFGVFCAAANPPVDLAAIGLTAEQVIESYRDAYPNIAGWRTAHGNWRKGGVWKAYEAAAFAAMNDAQTSFDAGRCSFCFAGGALRLTLPSGRTIYYRGASIENRVPVWGGDPRPTLVYQSPRGERTLYGGKIAENVVQALCRDLLASALVKCGRFALPVVLHVHDEIVCEVPDAEDGHTDAALLDLLCVMSSPPAWAAGFPVGAEGFASKRYMKGGKGYEYLNGRRTK